MNDLMNFIKSSINEKLLNNINDIFNNIFSLFIVKIYSLFNKMNKYMEEEEEDEIEDEIYKMIDSLEIFGEKLYQNNLSLFYFFTLKFTENFPYETNHKCFHYDENKQLVTFIKKDEENKHSCICPFMQVMIYVLMKRNNKQNSYSFINLFLQTYKNKLITSLCFINCFSELFYDNNYKIFREMGFQLVNENLSILVYEEQNIPFLESCFNDIYLVCDYFLKEKNYDKLSSIYSRFHQIIKYLPSRTIIDNINNNTNILKIIIDICCLSNYENTFENKIKFSLFQINKYNSSLLEVENYSIFTMISLIHLLNFDDQTLIDFIFNVILEKLYKFKNYRDNLPDKIFSPHLITIKCYSLFLNRYCFNYSIKHNCDLLDSFNHFLEIFPQAKEINIFLFKELIILFGFIISQLYSFFSYFGTDMIPYYINYCDCKLNFIKCDITLMKYLMSQTEVKKQFNLLNISFLSDIESSNEYFQNLINNENINDIESIDKTQEKNLKYINSVLELLYLIIRDNISMEKIVFRDIDFKLKINDVIYEKLYANEKGKIHNLVKNDIIHFILGNKNLVKRDDCIDFLERIYDGNYIELMDEILKNNCEKIVLTNSLIKFSLKKEMLLLCDIDYIISSKNRKNAIDYMNNFQFNNCNLLNLHVIEPLNIEKKLMKNVYQTFYNEKNIDYLIKLYNLIFFNKDNGSLLNQIFHFNLTKILSFGFKLCSTDLLDEDFKKILLEKMDNLEDKQFQKETINEKRDNKSLKDKLKRKYTRKNESLKDKIISSDMIIGDDENIQREQESCVYCHQSLIKNSNDLEYYGKINYYFSDYLTDILEKKLEGKRNGARKFVSCNHKIHFKCFNDFIFIHFDKEFECPLCKKLSNIILFDFTNLIEKNYGLIKGINYMSDKIILDDFYKKKEDNISQELLFANMLTFENYCSKLFKKEVLIKDINEDQYLLEKTLKLILDDFEEFTMYYSRKSKKKEQIEIWKNILYNIRLLFQYKILIISDNIAKIIENIFKLDNPEVLEVLLIYFNFFDIINIFIMFSFILFDSNEQSKEKIKNIFQNNILLYYVYVSFIKNKKNKENIDSFLTNNKEKLKNVLDLFLLKYKICLLLFNEEEENINNNISIEQIIPFIKSNLYLINSLNSAPKDNYISRIKELYIGIPEFNIINLPESGVEFLNRTNGNCFYCHKKNLSSYLCLLCGNKICNNIHCFIENGSKRGKEYSLIYHYKKCCGGNGLFLSISNAEIVYISKRRMIESKIFIYLNDFGDTLKDKYLNDEYKLNRDELKKGIMKFIDMTYRKNSFKIYFRDNNY